MTWNRKAKTTVISTTNISGKASDDFGVFNKTFTVPKPLYRPQVHTIPWNDEGSYSVTKDGNIKYVGQAK